MAEPFVFNFIPGQNGEPLQMYIADLRGVCALCGANQIQRFYPAHSFHTLTVADLEQLVSDAATKLNASCHNCGEVVDHTMTTDTSVTWAFADDSGVMVGWSNGGKPVWTVTPHTRLDPQALPGFDAPADAQSLNEEWIERTCARSFNPKQVWLDLFDDLRTEPDATFYDDVSHQFRVAVSDQSFAELCETFVFDEEHHVVRWGDEALGLPFHDSFEDLFAAPPAWVDADVLSRLAREDWFAGAAVPVGPIREQIERAFSVANLKFEYDDHSSTYRNITTPTEIEFGTGLSTVAVARRAVYTGMTPGSAARLSAEEVVGTLLRVWRS